MQIEVLGKTLDLELPQGWEPMEVGKGSRRTLLWFESAHKRVSVDFHTVFVGATRVLQVSHNSKDVVITVDGEVLSHSVSAEIYDGATLELIVADTTEVHVTSL